MKRYIFILFCSICFTLEVVAQSSATERESKARVRNWAEAPAAFDAVEVPDQWKEESAVILAKSNHLEYKKIVLVNQVQYVHRFHERVKLLDKKAIEKYSQFELTKSYRKGYVVYYNFAGFKIIKPDGRQILLSQQDGVEESISVNDHKRAKLKIALPNLEVGDILDYYIDSETLTSGVSGYYSFSPAIFQLSSNYPILNYRLQFDVMRKCYINFRSANHAPELQLQEGENKRKYYLEATHIDKVTEPSWFYKNRELPSIKFKAAFAINSAASPFLGKQGELKSVITLNEVSTLMKAVFIAPYIYKDFKKEMKKIRKTQPDPNVYAREAFYILRNMIGVKNLEDAIQKDWNTVRNLNRFNYVKTLSYFYRSYDVPHQVIVGVPRDISTLDNLILEEELIFAIRVNTKDPFYVSTFSNSSLIGEIDPLLQGISAFTFDGSELPYNCTLVNEKLPVSKPDENGEQTELKLSLVDGELKGTVTQTALGGEKFYEQSYIIGPDEIISDEKSTYGIDEKEYTTYMQDQKATDLQIRQEYLEEFLKNREERIKKSTESSYEITVDAIDRINVISTGRMPDSPHLTYSYDYASKQGIKKVGRNYLLEIGKFIGSQKDIPDEERERIFDIYMPYARHYTNEITFQIPEGYSVEGVEDLNVSVENETGLFMVEASVEGQTLKVYSKKQYNKHFEPKENWNQMLMFLDLASDFNQKKVLLRKID